MQGCDWPLECPYHSIVGTRVVQRMSGKHTLPRGIYVVCARVLLQYHPAFIFHYFLQHLSNLAQSA